MLLQESEVGCTCTCARAFPDLANGWADCVQIWYVAVCGVGDLRHLRLAAFAAVAWFAAFPVCGVFGLRGFRFAGFAVCGACGWRRLRFAASAVCGDCGLRVCGLRRLRFACCAACGVCGWRRLQLAAFAVCGGCGLQRLRFAGFAVCGGCGLRRLRFAGFAICGGWGSRFAVCGGCGLRRWRFLGSTSDIYQTFLDYNDSLKICALCKSVLQSLRIARKPVL